MTKQFVGFYDPTVNSFDNLLVLARLWHDVMQGRKVTRTDAVKLGNKHGLKLTNQQIDQIVATANQD